MNEYQDPNRDRDTRTTGRSTMTDRDTHTTTDRGPAEVYDRPAGRTGLWTLLAILVILAILAIVLIVIL